MRDVLCALLCVCVECLTEKSEMVQYEHTNEKQRSVTLFPSVGCCGERGRGEKNWIGAASKREVEDGINKLACEGDVE